jgi:hypothetical protein
MDFDGAGAGTGADEARAMADLDGAGAGGGVVDAAGAQASPGACAIGTSAGVAVVAIFIGLTTIIVPGADGTGAAAIAGATAFAGTGGTIGCIATSGAAGATGAGCVASSGLAASVVVGVENSVFIASDGGTGDFHGRVEARIIAGGVLAVNVGAGAVTCATTGAVTLFAVPTRTGGALAIGAALASVGRP